MIKKMMVGMICIVGIPLLIGCTSICNVCNSKYNHRYDRYNSGYGGTAEGIIAGVIIGMRRISYI